MKIGNGFVGRIVVAVSFGLFLLVFHLPMLSAEETIDNEYQFICENDAFGLSVVDVLQASGDHSIFLDLFRRYDPEGFAILSDVKLADKTVWAPTDTAFLAINDTLSTLPAEEIKAILGYHISPPRRVPFTGSYPVVTPQFLLDAGKMIHRTRTGILTGSDQRTQTLIVNGVLSIEDARIKNTAWCTEAGSVFSLDAVIMNVPTPSVLVKTINRIVHILL